MHLVISLPMKLKWYTVDQIRKDRPSWTLSKNQCFLVKSLYNRMDKGRGDKRPTIWGTISAPRLAFFAWEALWGRALTLDNVQRKCISLANWCYLCQGREESINHLLLHCEKTQMLWNLLLSLFGQNLVLVDVIKDTLLAWQTKVVRKQRHMAWKAAPLCLDSMEAKE